MVLNRSFLIFLSAAYSWAEAVVDACMKASTHYIDVCGELPWMRLAIAEPVEVLCGKRSQ